MALARIITRSQTCSRELALVLLARGYTVEIVSPDKVPDNIADLELRVDAGLGNQLIANVEAHGGERTASLEFVHHLKAPLLDLMRRPPQLGKPVESRGEPVTFNTEPGIDDKAKTKAKTKTKELPEEPAQLAPSTVSPAVKTLPNRELSTEIDPEKVTRLIAPQVLTPAPVEPPAYFAVEDAAIPQSAKAQSTIIRLPQSAPRCDRSAGWPWRATLAFAGVLLLAFVLEFSAHSRSKAGAQSSQASRAGTAASTGANPLSHAAAEKDPARDSGQSSALSWPLAALDLEGNSSNTPKETQVAKPGTPTLGPRTAVSHRRSDDVVARNTTIYFDKRFEPAPKTKQAHLKNEAHGIGNKSDRP